MRVITQQTNNQNRKWTNVKLQSISCVVFALMLVVASFALAVKPPKPPKPEKPGGKGERTAQVTISGPMETEVAQTFPIAKDSEQTLELNRGSWTEWGPVPIRYNFANTVDTWLADTSRDTTLDDLAAFLVDDAGEFPVRWSVLIRIDMSSLKNVGDSSTTSSDGHFIDIWTDPTEAIMDIPVRVRLWIPEGPRGPSSGPVTVTMVEDRYPGDGTRVRTFEFTSNMLQVVTYPKGSEKKVHPRKILRCANLDDAITVTVVTTP